MVKLSQKILIRKEDILKLLEEVKDPEIPVLSLVDLGVISDVRITSGKIHVILTPTFTGCPATEVMRQETLNTLKKYGFDASEVTVSYENPWSSDKISEKGRTALKKFGLAPPVPKSSIDDIEVLSQVACPYCDSPDTEMTSPFGPTLCRSLHYCHRCKQAFQQFKPL